MRYQKTLGLFELIQQIGADPAQNYLNSAFRCRRNPDVERFLLEKAVRFELAGGAATHLILGESGEILAYFALSFKSVRLDVSKTLLKKFSGGLGSSPEVRVFLIGQIGKNDLEDNPVALSDILAVAFKTIRIASRLVGGRVVILECENNPKLLNLYENHGFKLIETQNDRELKTLFIIPNLRGVNNGG